jgi:arylsulfatase A-like enzyme
LSPVTDFYTMSPTWIERMLTRASLAVVIPTLLLVLACSSPGKLPVKGEMPNIVLIMTDDQGYGDLGFHGNPVIKTPTIDSLAGMSARFTQFYVSPVCAPTRSSLMTGRYSIRTGVYDTYNGGAIMAADEITVAEYLKEAGYVTGIFGKWHLGDSYPFRPIDQGFDVSLVHAGGGIGQPGDFYENFIKGDSSYFNPILSTNGKKTQTRGYCSDVFTDHAIQFIRDNRQHPFFLYLPYNAPHTPLQLPQKYYEIYRETPPELFLTDTVERRNQLADEDIEEAKRVYGMVTNIDDNLKRLFKTIHELGIRQNTLIIFITDNGPQGHRYNAGLRARKGSVFDGGIRVPSFWSWPGKIQPGVELMDVAAHIDILPTILDICHIPSSERYPFDGRSLWPLLSGGQRELENRDLVSHWVRGFPEPYHNIALRNGDLKLVGQGSYLEPGQAVSLFDLKEDQGEQTDLREQLPDTVISMKKRFDDWYETVIRNPHLAPLRIQIGTEFEDPVILNRNDTKGPMAKKWMDPRALGYWEVTVVREGIYDVSMRFFDDIRAGDVTFRVGSIQRTVAVTEDSTNLIQLPDIRLLPGNHILEGWLFSENEFYAPIYIELARKSN